ncbi:hypothetical protein EDB92DRAFT_1549672 [Lactarius akahatsu]|uniref:Cytochrome P450 n=1 Tax=Lactarius akahatsu TaxID=416441 RepID=A0AAD4LEB1_9AGAM|nr:hypothetical protein EDB92DRAFT_1549672 [Lactarius akahatsu]
MYWWALAMVANPEVQRRAQAELDTVVGRSRIPTFQTLRTIRTYRRWSKILSNCVHFFRYLSPTPRQRTTGPTGCSSLREPYALQTSGSITVTHLLMVRMPRASHLSGSWTRKIIPGPAETREEEHSTYGFGRRICVGTYHQQLTLYLRGHGTICGDPRMGS